ncbi:hypothetical protein N9W89_05235 [Hellea sp.]|nr:hypothetical protein [Hellea sp.]
MIFRRIKAHVEKENWFAVFLDFCIVVVGVFIGIQVANWNASQFEAREETAIIERLQSDFKRIEQDADRSLAFHTQMTEDMRTVLRSLRSGELKDENIPAFERALLLGTGFQTSADRSGSFTELMSSGRGNILRDRDLLHALVDYEDFLERFAIARSYYVESALLATRDFKDGFEYDIELRFTEDIFALVEQEQSLVSYDFEMLASDPTFYNAVEELLFVHSGFTIWRSRISDRIDIIQQNLAAKEP